MARVRPPRIHRCFILLLTSSTFQFSCGDSQICSATLFKYPYILTLRRLSWGISGVDLHIGHPDFTKFVFLLPPPLLSAYLIEETGDEYSAWVAKFFVLKRRIHEFNWIFGGVSDVFSWRCFNFSLSEHN